MIIPYLIQAIGFWVFILFALINLSLLAPIYLFYVGQYHYLCPPFTVLFTDNSRNCQPSPGAARHSLLKRQLLGLESGEELY